MNLIELLVVIAIIALLVGILIPSLQAAREIAKQTNCLTNLRGIGSAAETYQGGFGAWPHAATKPANWQPCPERQLLQAKSCAQALFFCPSDEGNSYEEVLHLFENSSTGDQVRNLFWLDDPNHEGLKYVRQMDRFDRSPPFEYLQSSYMWNECLLEDPGILEVGCSADIGVVSEGNHVANRYHWTCLIEPSDCRRDQVHWNETVNVLYGDGHATSVALEQINQVSEK